jgi:hypothetical protein
LITFQLPNNIIIMQNISNITDQNGQPGNGGSEDPSQQTDRSQNDPDQQNQKTGTTGGENDDYKREGVQLGASYSGSNQSVSSGGNQGGAGGYDVNREKEQIREEREGMQSERNLEDVNVEEQRTGGGEPTPMQPERPEQPTTPSEPAKEPGQPEKSPGQPHTEPGTQPDTNPAK